MKHLKPIAMTTAVTAGMLLLGTGVLHAATQQNVARPKNTLVQALAKKFNLKESDIQQVIEDERKAARNAGLDAAVESGKITQAQKALIIAKQDEMHAAHEALKDKTPEERAEAMKAQMEALKAWAEANKIPLELIHSFGRGPGMGGKMGGKMRGAFGLERAVESGKLTQAQADAIKAKMEEMRETLQNATPEERLEALKTWAQQNGIPEDFLPGAHGKQKVFGGR